MYQTNLGKQEGLSKESLQTRLLERIHSKKKENQPQIYLKEEVSTDEDKNNEQGAEDDADDECE
jgi:hypothetical protein